jgi:hypothetical protein
MAAASTPAKKKPVAKRASAAAKLANASPLALAPAELKAFHHNDGLNPDFGFSRFWWEGDGPREGIGPKVLKKFQPVADPDDPEAITAAKTDLVLPSDAQADYAEARHLLERFDAKLPAREKHAYVQITLRFPGATNIHGPFEEARAFAWEYLVIERRLATFVVVHAPFFAGSETSALHVHLISPLRRLGALGWGEMETWLQNDRGRVEVFEAWTTFRRQWRGKQVAV